MFCLYWSLLPLSHTWFYIFIYFFYKQRPSSVYVDSVTSGSIGETSGLRPGDRIEIVELIDPDTFVVMDKAAIVKPSIVELLKTFYKHQIIRLIVKSDFVGLSVSKVIVDSLIVNVKKN